MESLGKSENAFMSRTLKEFEGTENPSSNLKAKICKTKLSDNLELNNSITSNKELSDKCLEVHNKNPISDTEDNFSISIDLSILDELQTNTFPQEIVIKQLNDNFSQIFKKKNKNEIEDILNSHSQYLERKAKRYEERYSYFTRKLLQLAYYQQWRIKWLSKSIKKNQDTSFSNNSKRLRKYSGNVHNTINCLKRTKEK